MKKLRAKAGVALAGALLVCSLPTQGATPSNEELFQIIQQQNQRIESLETELRNARTNAPAQPIQQGQQSQQGQKALEEKIETQQKQINALAEREQKPSKLDKVSIGGYGEMHYNNLDAEDRANDLDELDFHRFVLFFGYDFTENLRFYSELEVEHSFVEGDDSPGAVELEQAYVQYDFNSSTSILGGQFLTPVGILNETHEPTTFYGVERNDVENIIIPTTYRVGGAQVTHRFGEGFQVDLSVHEGLLIDSTDPNDAFRVRDGRQSTGEAIARDPAYTLRVKYSGIPGVELGGAVQYETDASQVNNDALESGLLWEVHSVINRGIFGFRALYAEWNFDINNEIALANGISAAQIARGEDQTGWYVEPSVKPFEKVGFYTRYEDVEGARTEDVFDQWEFGLNYWPHPDVVLKFDYRFRDLNLPSERGRDFDGFDLGIGYQF